MKKSKKNSFLFRLFKFFLYFLGIIFIIGILGGGISYYIFIILYPGEYITRQNIMKIISTESPVFYKDGVNKIGVFFEEEHRLLLKIKKDNKISEAEDYIPEKFIKALIAAEDRNFYNHFGIDLRGILRATLVNLKAKKIVQGGSTLTQQTAKNLFRRKGRTFKGKLLELINALKLEAHYTKDEILEFYINQFYVNGNGRGLGIASKYFFNKSAKDLNWVESAFIAGAIKSPNQYNPFDKKDEKEVKAIEEKSFRRKNYVLQRAYDLGMITKEEFEKYSKEKVPFKKGEFRYNQSVILDFVRSTLEGEFFKRILSENGIFNLATSGIKIYTTIDKEIQEDTLYSFKRNLSRLETILNGYKKAEKKEYPIIRSVEEKGFYYGTIKEIVNKGEQSFIIVNLGNIDGKIDFLALQRMAEFIKTYNTGVLSQKPNKKDIEDLLKYYEVGDSIYVSVRKNSKEGVPILDIEQYPSLNGGFIVLDKGKIVSMVGGFENENFNRAVNALRQPGSAFKPVVYYAALQLGWSNLDPLINKKIPFFFQGQFYFPGTEHAVESYKVSMAWAGAKSENIASVYLLYHLCDKLTYNQFKELAKRLDMVQRSDEDENSYKKRLREKFGIIMNDELVKWGIFDESKEEVITELIFDGEEEQIEELTLLQYGYSFSEGERELKQSLKSSEKDIREIYSNISLLYPNFLQLKMLNENLKEKLQELKPLLNKSNVENLNEEENEKIDKLLEGFYILPTCYNNCKIIYKGNKLNKNLSPLTLEKYLEIKNNSEGEIKNDLLDSSNILIDGVLSSKIIDLMNQTIEDKFLGLQKYPPYDFHFLYYHRNFRILLGIKYVISMCKKLGIKTPLQPVLSLPLGSNAITLLELAQVYQTMLDGKIYYSQDNNIQNEAFIISRIEDDKGEIIYEHRPKELQVIEPQIGYLSATILRSVIKYGTGKSADRKISIRETDFNKEELKGVEITIPAYGKTGTTDNYTNTTFVGFIPYLSENNLSNTLELKNSFVLASYVGYDDNKPIVHTNNKIRITGALGALPAWIDTANFIIRRSENLKYIDPFDLTLQLEGELPMIKPQNFIRVNVDPQSGLVRGDFEDKYSSYFVETLGVKEGTGIELKRIVAPFKE